MKINTHTLHATSGKVLDCTCEVEITCDEETVGLYFPSLQREGSVGPGPQAYAHIDGTELRTTLINRDSSGTEFAWDEEKGVWHECG